MSEMKKICIVAGARPNFIKVAPLIRVIGKAEGATYELVYTGREDDPTLEPSLFTDLQVTECAWRAHDGQPPDEDAAG